MRGGGPKRGREAGVADPPVLLHKNCMHPIRHGPFVEYNLSSGRIIFLTFSWSFMPFDSFVKVRRHSGEHYAIFFRGIYIQMS